VSLIVELTTHLPCDPKQVIEQVKTSRLLRYVAAPLIVFKPISYSGFPTEWHEGTHWVKLFLWGIIPMGKQAIVISYPSPREADTFVLRDNGHSALIKTWDHLITVQPCEGGTCYTDRVDVKAGVLTPFVWLFARIFYAHRQRRWRHLVAKQFNDFTESR